MEHAAPFTIIGERVTYTNWMPARQNNVYSHNIEDCVVLVPSKQGQWDDINCYTLLISGSSVGRTEVNPYVCEYSKFYCQSLKP